MIEFETWISRKLPTPFCSAAIAPYGNPANHADTRRLRCGHDPTHPLVRACLPRRPHPRHAAEPAGTVAWPPARISERLAGLTPATLTGRENESWSIQENVGHLWDLEELRTKRLEDFLAGRDQLTPAGLQNTKTTEARHNDKDLSAIVAGFRAAREVFVASLEKLTPEDLGRTSLHPRLQQPMTILGLCHFIAEHDDHHLARITELIRWFGT